MFEWIGQPWPWYVAGPLIGLVVPFVFWYGGKRWGVSSTLQHLCAATFPRGLEYFRYDWWGQGGWHLAMGAGMVVGGFLGAHVLGDPERVIEIAADARADLTALGIQDFGGMLPDDLFSWGSLLTMPGAAIILGGGFLVGFGARWAGGCTSGHAMSGLSNLQRSSFTAVLGFFAGGLVSSWILLPLLLGGAP